MESSFFVRSSSVLAHSLHFDTQIDYLQDSVRPFFAHTPCMDDTWMDGFHLFRKGDVKPVSTTNVNVTLMRAGKTPASKTIEEDPT